jgi:pilus assembly protein FimV
LAEEAAPAASSRRPAFQVTQEDLETYGPVQRGQTLWSIASDLSGDSGVSVNQMMLAIQRYNPEAFGQGNINLLRSGAILRLPPPSEVARMNARQAVLESMRQAEDYAEILAGRAPESRPAPILAEPGMASGERPDDARTVAVAGADEGRLELVPPVDDPAVRADSGAAGPGESDLTGRDAESADQANLLLEEEQEAVAQETEYLSQRIQELQEELGGEAPVEVQDKGLAEMEQQLREQRSGEESDNAPPPARKEQATDGLFPALADHLPWLFLLLLILIAGSVFWWRQRRSHAATTEIAVESPSETARAIASEAEEIVRTLGAASEAESRTDETRETTAPIIDLEDYIGHIERDPLTGGGADVPDADESSDGGAGSGQRSEGELPGDGAPRAPDRQQGLGDDEGESDEEAVEANDPETKLDLARAYISMGDADAARGLLIEVMRDGNEAQVAEALAMMEEV